MFVELINWAKVFTAIGNIVLVSIPEEAFLVMFILIILKQFDFLESKKDGGSRFIKRDIIEISIPVLFVATFSNVLRYLGVDANIILLASIVSLFILVVTVFKQWTIIGIAKTFFATLLSFFVLVLIEFSYAPLVFYITNKSAEYFYNSVYLNFMLTLPERIIEYSLVAYFILKKVTFLKSKFITPIIASKTLTALTISMFAFNLIVFSVIGKIIWFDKILTNYSIYVQVSAVSLALMLPIFNIAALLGCIYHIKNKEIYNNYLTKEIMVGLTEDLVLYTNNRDFNKMQLTLKDMSDSVKDM